MGFWVLVFHAFLVALSVLQCAAADLDETRTRTVSDATLPLTAVPRYEVRGGVFQHGLGSVERNTLDLNLEVLFQPLPIGTNEWWTILVPRPHLGGFINTAGRTDIGYAGALWRFPIYNELFTELFFGGAVHNGLRDGSPTRSALGCPFGFNFGASVGYSFTRTWSMVGTYNHMSNGNSSVGTDCPHNRGVNNVGLKLGYAF